MITCFQNRTGRCGGVVIRGAAWITILSMILQPVVAWAGTFNSTTSGNYDGAPTNPWGVSSPWPGDNTPGDMVTINSPNVITVDDADDPTGDTITINTGGTLSFGQSPNSTTLTLGGGTVVAKTVISDPGTGGTVTSSPDGTKWIHTFAAGSNVTLTDRFTASSAIDGASVLVVAGGGGGGNQEGAGGGAGGLIYQTDLSLSGSYDVTVGAGGAGGPTVDHYGAHGTNSTFGTLFTAIGGGAGSSNYMDAPTNIRNGGSGGGAGGYRSTENGLGTTGQGKDGGVTTTGSASGGGGAGFAGTGGVSGQGGKGGDGLAFAISGTSQYYAGGGGGGDHFSSNDGTGGLGGGGTAADGQNHDATYYGGGGGGGGHNTEHGGAGYRGIVIVSYPKVYNTPGPLTLSGPIAANSGTSTLDAYGSGGVITVSSGISGSGGINIASSLNSGGVVIYDTGYAQGYTGNTTVGNGSTLRVNGTMDSQSATVTVSSGGILGGTGTINRRVTVNAGGNLAAGASIGTLNITYGTGDALTLTPGAIVNLEADATATCDLVNVTGNFNYTPGNGTKYVLKLIGSQASVSQTYKFLQWSGTGPAAGDLTADWTLDTTQSFPPSADTHFTNAGGGSWTIAGNWDGTAGINSHKIESKGTWLELNNLTSGTSVPTSSQNVYIRPDASVVVTGPTDPSTTIASLTIGKSGGPQTAGLQIQTAGGNLTVTGAATVTPYGALTVQSGRTFTAASLATSGTTTFDSGATILVPSVTVSGGTFSDSGTGAITTLTVTSGTATFAASAPVTTANLSGGSTSIGAGTVAATVSSAANLTMAGGTVGSLSVNANYAGTTTINQGVLGYNAPVIPATTSGTFNLNHNTMTTLTVNGAGSTTVLGNGATVSGTLSITAGTLKVADSSSAVATVGTADFNNFVKPGGVPNYTVNTQAGKLGITSTLKLAGGITGTYTAGGSATYFTIGSISGSNIADKDADRTFTLSGGKVELKGVTITAGGNLIGRWSMDEGSGTTVANSGTLSGIPSATFAGTTSWTTGGKFGNAVQVKGENPGGLSVANFNTAFNFTSDFTISTWMKYDATSGGFARLFGHKSGWNGSDGWEIWRNNSTTEVFVNTGDGNYAGDNFDVFNSSGVSDWFLLTFTIKQGSGNTTEVKCYKNDTLIGTKTGKPTLVSNTQALKLAGGTDANFKGYMDEVRLYNKVLTGSEVTAMYGSGSGDLGGGANIDFSATAVAATASSILDLGAPTGNHTLGAMTLSASASADTVLTVSNAAQLTITSLTVKINGANIGKLSMAGITLVLSPTTEITVDATAGASATSYLIATAKTGSFSTQPTAKDTTGKAWTVEVKNGGTELWVNKPAVAPTVSTPTVLVSSISSASATLGATVDNNGGASLSERGIVWNTTGSPVTENSSDEGNHSIGTFTYSRSGLPAGTKIYYRGYAVNSAGTGYSSDTGSFYTEPATQASGVSFSEIASTSMKISWSAGGGAGRIVLVKAGSAVDAAPVDGTDVGYTADATFKSGTQIGTGNYVVYKGTGASEVTVTGLNPSTAYHVAVYAYAGTGDDNGVNKGINYRTDNVPTGNQTTLSGIVVPTLSLPTAPVIGATTATLGATVDSDGNATITDYGVVWGGSSLPTTTTGNIVSKGGTPGSLPVSFTVDAAGLTAGAKIYYRGYAVNSVGPAYSAEGSFYAEPATQATGVSFDSVSSTGMTIKWTAGTGGAGRIVLVKAGSAVDAPPVDGTDNGYVANTTFGSGTQVGTLNYVVFKGDGTQVDVTGLTEGTTYYVAVYEYAGSGPDSGVNNVNKGINYLTSSPATGNQTISKPTVTTPTVSAIGAATATLGANVTGAGGTVLTSRGTVWGASANPTLNADSSGGTATGVFVQNRTGLSAGTKIYYRGYAVNSVGTAYSTDGSFYTEPATQASGVSFSAIGSRSMTISWTAGTGGAGRIVLVKAGSAVTGVPADGMDTGYTANSVFGSGTLVGDGYVVFKGNGTSVTLSGLSASTTYYVAVFEYAGSGNDSGDNKGINYLGTPATGNATSDVQHRKWWDGSSDTSWNVPANWSSVIGGGADPGAVPGDSDDVIFNSSASTIANRIGLLGGNQAAQSLTFNANATTAITLANNTLTLGAGGIVVDAASGDHTISSGIAVGANNQTWNIGGNRTLTASGVIGGSATITKTGTGTLTLAAAKDASFSGTVTVSGGVLSNVLPQSTLFGYTVVLDGGTYRGFEKYANLPTVALTTNGGMIEQALNSFYNGWSDGVTITLQGSGSRTLTLGQGTGVYPVLKTALADSGGATSLTKSWGSELTSNAKSAASYWGVTAVCTYTGPTTVTGGRLALGGASGALNGTSSILAAGGTFMNGDPTTAANNDSARVNTASTVTLGSSTYAAGGTYSMALNDTDAGTALVQQHASLTINPGQNTINSVNTGAADKTGTLYFNATAITHNAGGTLNVVPATGFGSTLAVGGVRFNSGLVGNLVNGIVGPWAFYNETSYATAVNSVGSDWIQALTYAGQTVQSDWTDSAVNYDVAAAGQTLGASRVANTLRYAGGTIALGGNTLTTAGLLLTGDTTISSTGSGHIAFSGSELVIRVASGKSLTLSAPIQTAGKLTIVDGGESVVTLSGDNSSVTDVYLSDLWSNIGDGFGFSFRSFALNNANALGGSSDNTSTLFFMRGFYNFGVTQTYAKNVVIGTSDNYFKSSAATTLSGPVSLQGVMSINTPSNMTLSGNISGPGSIILGITSIGAGGGKLILSGSANTYTGGTTVNESTLELQKAGAATGSIVNNAAVVFNIAADGAYAGSMTGTGTLTKQGAGALTLSGNHSYSGTTTVSAGTLNVNGTLGTGTAAVTVSTGKLGGTGMINRPVTFQTGSTLVVDAAAPNQLTVSGAVTLTGSPSIEVLNGPLSAASYTILTATSISGTFNPATVPAGYVISYTATTVTLAKPPPTVTTPTVSAIGTATATLGANVTSDGGLTLSERGTVWGTTASPTGNAVAKSGTSTGVFTHSRDSLAAGKIYYRGYAVNSAGTGYSSDGSFYTEPATQASNVSISDIASTSMKISWTAGTGGAGRIVLVKAGSAVDTPPSDGIDNGYTANFTFPNGTEIGTGNHVVYKGNGTSVSVIGLTLGVTYYVAVYEYAGTGDDNGDNKGINYRTDSVPTASATTINATVVPTLSLPTVTAIGAATATLGATVDSDGGANLTSRGTVWNTTGSPVTENSLAEGQLTLGVFAHARTPFDPGTKIYYRGYAVNSVGPAYSAQGSFYTEPATQASDVLFDNVSSTGMTIKWKAGTGGAGRIVLVKAGSAVNAPPVDGMDYMASTTFQSGAQIGTGNYVVYKSSGTQVNVAGLTAGTTYYVAVYEYAGSGNDSGDDKGINYLTGSPATGNQTTFTLPTVTTPTVSAISATTATLGANVTGAGGTVLTSRGTVWNTTGSPVTQNSLAASGTSVDPFTHVRDGLNAGTKIYYRGYAVNSVGTAYSTDGSFYTEPSAQASVVTFSQVKSTSMTVSWTAGSGGAGRIVLVKAGSAVDAEPADGTDSGYTASAAFRSGTQIGTGNFVAFKGNGTSVNLTGLTPSTVYHVAVFEYAGSGDTVDPNQGINYLQTSPARNSTSSSSGVQYWDPNGTLPGSGNQGGEWSTSAANWNSESSGTGGTLNNWLGESAVFSAGTDGIGSLTVTVPNDIAANNVTIEEGTITLDVANSKTLTFNAGYTLGGRTGLTKAGAGTLTLGGANLLTGGISISAGTLTTPTGGGLALGNNSITLSGTSTLNLITGSYIREFSGSSGTAITPLNKTIYLNSLNDATFSGTLDSGGGGGTFHPFYKTGPGTQTFQSALTASYPGQAVQCWRGGLDFAGSAGAYVSGTYSGDIEMRGGSLTLDDSTADINRWPDATPIKLFPGGGVLRYLGQASVNSGETVGALDMAVSAGRGSSVLAVDVRPGGSGVTATLTFDSQGGVFSIGGGSALQNIVNFTTTGTLGTDAFVKFSNTSPTLVNNVMRSSFANGTDIATYDATKGVIPFNAVGGAAPAYIAAASAVATDTAYLNAALSLSADTTWSALKVDGVVSLDLNNHALMIGNGAGSPSLGSLIVKTGAGEAEIKNTTGDQSLTQTFLDIYVNSGTLKITAPLAIPSGTYWVSVNKAGAGLLWLAPKINWSGTYAYDGGRGIYFSDGAIRMNPNLGGVGTASCFQNATMVLAGGVMEIVDGITYNPTIGTGAANLLWQASGGFAAYGSDASFSPSIVWNAANHIPDGAALLLNSTTADSKITLLGTLNLGTDPAKMYLREICVADNTGSTTDLAEISGQIISDTTAGGGGTATYTYPLVKTGAGILILSHNNNTYSGATYVKEGTLLVNGTLAAPASTAVAVNPDYSAVTVMSGGALGGSGTINRSVNFQTGSKIAVNAAAANQLTVNGAVTLSGTPAIMVVGGTLSASSYTLLTATSISGTFDEATVPAGYVISHTSTTVTLTKTHTLTYSAADANGSIVGTTSQTVNHGANGSLVTATPALGYHFVSWSDAYPTAARTDLNVTADKNVTATFAINTYTLAYTAGAHGSIDGTTPQTVNHGADGSLVTATPAPGYHFASWSDAYPTAARTDHNVTGDKNVTATFAMDTHTLTYSVVANGSISGITPQIVNDGGSGTQVTAVPAAGYHFVSWSDGVLTAARTDAGVIDNITVTATFAQTTGSVYTFR